jgi:ligand-binding SRPBCC domain-containing protein
MSARRTIRIASDLAAPPEVVWKHATTLRTINEEMGPWLYMTHPAAARDLSLSDVGQRGGMAFGTPLFSSWVLLLRCLPVERMQVTITELEDGARFVEQSKTLLMKSWRHERRVEPRGSGCTVTDILTVEPPIGLFAGLVAACVSWFFGHRHAQLRRRFGLLPVGGGDR